MQEINLSHGVYGMPLTRRQFDLGVDEIGENLMRKVYELLAANRELAYSYDELRHAILGQPTPVKKLGQFRRAVDALVGIGAVDLRRVARKNYFAFLQEFDTGTWKSMKLALRP